MTRGTWWTDEAHAECRVLTGHRWRRLPGQTYPDIPAAVAFRYRCQGCGAERTDAISWVTGALLRRRYELPDGYRVPAEDGRRVKRVDLRAAYVAALVPVSKRRPRPQHKRRVA